MQIRATSSADPKRATASASASCGESAVGTQPVGGFEQVVLGLGDDVVGVGQPRHRVAQLDEVRGDQAVAGHGGAPTTRCIVTANALHSWRFSRAALWPRRVRE